MNREQFERLEVGDRIEFRSLTRHNTRKQIRIITGFSVDHFAGPNHEHVRGDFALVRFEGSPNFYVRRSEIIRKL